MSEKKHNSPYPYTGIHPAKEWRFDRTCFYPLESYPHHYRNPRTLSPLHLPSHITNLTSDSRAQDIHPNLSHHKTLTSSYYMPPVITKGISLRSLTVLSAS